jgi:UV DNA damage repair endonuclease
MKLAEALILRADYQRRIEQLKQRLLRNAKVQEGDKPAENPKELTRELEQVSEELQQLIQRINKTNSATELQAGVTLSDALAARDIMRLKHGIYRELAQMATVTQGRYTKSEVKFKSTVNVAEIQKQADRLAQEHRELDAKIQEVNWRTELLE